MYIIGFVGNASAKLGDERWADFAWIIGFFTPKPIASAIYKMGFQFGLVRSHCLI